MKRLEHMKESLMACVESQICGNLSQADAHELGAAVDMIKDLSEAIYYCTITEAMEEKEEDKEKSSHQQQPAMYYPPMYQGNTSYHMPYDTMRPPMYNDGSMYNNGMMYNQGTMYNDGTMYANGSNNSNSSGGNNARGGGSRGYSHMPMGHERDMREGSSPIYRRMYMESKQLNQDSAKNMQDLEQYLHELSNDIMEMIDDASPEEKQVMRQKITALATKIK